MVNFLKASLIVRNLFTPLYPILFQSVSKITSSLQLMMGSGREELQYLCPNIPTWVHRATGFISTSIAQFSYPQNSLYSTSICINVKFILLPADPVRCHSCNSVVNVFSLMQRRHHLVMPHCKVLRISLRLNIARPAGGRHT